MSPDERIWNDMSRGVDRAARIVSVLLVLGIIAVAFSGCVASNLAEVVKELSQDPASVCIRVTSVYGTLTYARANSTSDTMCDIFKMTGSGGVTTIPISVRPTFEMRPPVMETPQHPSRVPGPPK